MCRRDKPGPLKTSLFTYLPPPFLNFLNATLHVHLQSKLYTVLFISFLSLFFCLFLLATVHRHTGLEKSKALLLSFVVWLHITAIRKFMSFLSLFLFSFSLGDCLHCHIERLAHSKGKVLLLSFVVWLHITAIRKFMSLLSLFFLSFLLATAFIVTQKQEHTT